MRLCFGMVVAASILAARLKRQSEVQTMSLGIARVLGTPACCEVERRKVAAFEDRTITGAVVDEILPARTLQRSGAWTLEAAARALR
jgi:hypothetical protein